MKGVVFTEFLEMVEKEFGVVVLDKLITETPEASQEGYTAVGTYSYQEFVALLVNLSKETNISIDELTKAFGSYLFSYFLNRYAHMLSDIGSTFELLDQLESYIHVEVRKLYSDAELPYFETISMDKTHMVLHYKSKRRMASFAEGLINAAAKHFNENIHVEKDFLHEDGSWVSFILDKK